jgi:prepilin peptidase CpaA
MFEMVSMVLFLSSVSFVDLKFGKIPNWMTIPAILFGLSYHVLSGGREGLFYSVQGLILGMGLLLVPFMMGGMGGGDVKLLGAIGSYVGPMMTLRIFMVSAVLGLIVSLIVIIAVSEYRDAYSSMIIRLLKRGRSRPDTEKKDRGFPRIYLPYGVVLATGALFSFYLFP